jgi:hypothetical protein
LARKRGSGADCAVTITPDVIEWGGYELAS